MSDDPDTKGPEASTEKLLQEVLQATSDFVGVFDPAGRARYMNWPLRSFCGFDFHQEIESMEVPWFDHYAPWAVAVLKEEGIPEALRDGTWVGETALVGWGGTEIPVSELIVVHRDASGAVHRISSVARDLTDQKRTQDTLVELVDELADLKLAMEESTIAAVTDATGALTEVNRSFCGISGYLPEELLGNTPRILNSGFHPKAFFEGLWRTILAGDVWRGEIRNRAKNGDIYWVDSVIVPRLGLDGKPVRYLLLGMDITERKRQEDELRASEARFRTLVEAARSVVVGLGPDGRVQEWNPEAERVFGCRRQEALGQPFLGRFLPPSERDRIEPMIQSVLHGEDIHDFEMEVPDPRGNPIVLLWKLARILDLDGKPMALIGMAQDISDRKAALERAVHMAHHDTLTHLPNRALFQERVDFALLGAERHPHRMGLLFLDLDRFKAINDSLGHDAAFVARKVIEALGIPAQLGPHLVSTTPSIGIALYPEHGKDVESLTKRADEAMYRAKHAGRNRFEFA